MINNENNDFDPAKNLTSAISYHLDKYLALVGDGDNKLYHYFKSSFDAAIFMAAMKRSKGKKTKVALMLGLNRNTVNKRIKQLSLNNIKNKNR